MNSDNWDATDAINFLAFGDGAPEAYERWSEEQFQAHGVDLADPTRAERWSERVDSAAEFTTAEHGVLDEARDRCETAIRQLIQWAAQNEITITGKRKNSAARRPIPQTFWDGAEIDTLGEDGGEAFPTMRRRDGADEPDIFAPDYEQQCWVGLRFNPAELRKKAKQQPARVAVPLDWYDQTVMWFTGDYLPKHLKDAPHPDRLASYRAARERFPGWPIKRDVTWYDDIWKNHAPDIWKKPGSKAEIK